MIYEKKKLLIYKLISFALLLLVVFIPIIKICNKPKDAKIIKDNGYINYYYEYLNETVVDMEVTFDNEVSSANITIAFYDREDNLLETKTEYFYSYGENKTFSKTIYSIDGKVDSYEILDYEVTMPPALSYLLIMILIYGGIFIFIFFIGTLLLSCKIYNYNGNEIVVYAGGFHHYIKVNGIKTDEHNTIISYTAIHLSCTLDDGTLLDATISMTNRISLKINNKLYLGKRR